MDNLVHIIESLELEPVEDNEVYKYTALCDQNRTVTSITINGEEEGWTDYDNLSLFGHPAMGWVTALWCWKTCPILNVLNVCPECLLMAKVIG